MRDAAARVAKRVMYAKCFGMYELAHSYQKSKDRSRENSMFPKGKTMYVYADSGILS